MGQDEILVCLKKIDRPLNIKEISNKTRIGKRSIQRAILVLVESKDVHKLKDQGRKCSYKINEVRHEKP